ncbi:hypothetical protein [Mesorhizobium sp. M1E.F.Ca.ET.063.01.1.1]|uniref:hypothetical protein n=1 Tax=Mesorhizobium sp. M1E.F.Ca.ET.063.01.1.1 TaxID=2496750 RepID=UPI000FCBD903|nr:hypothetical protein [Mesorhizobium sp. M1E.F.Ca.ET.063.01.1.1]RUW85122.1 hypothetical protein EOA29_06250 [Mesorhizobium sp. M1E.F.Ca.ET.063.01.1.1]
MNDLDPRDRSSFQAMLDFFRDHPPVEDDLFGGDSDVGEEYEAAILAAFPNAGDHVIAVAEETVTRRKVTILGLEIVDFGRQLEVVLDENQEVLQVGYIGPVPVVRLPDGKAFILKSAYDLAELRAMLKPSLEPPAKDGDKAH